MPRVPVDKASFAAGQIDEAASRDRTKTIYDGGCSSALNYRICVGGSRMKRRPGTRYRATLSNGKSVGKEFVLKSGSIFKVIFSNARFDVYNSSNALVDTVTLCPWGSADLDQLYFEVVDDQLLVFHNDFMFQKITADTAETSWATADFAFASAPGGGTAQPYWNFQTPGTTLTPSALTGSITLTASAAHFVAGHSGTIIRYGGKEVLVTAFTDSTHVTGTVLQTLPQTVNVTLASTTGFLVDESVEGVDSGARGVITAVAGTQLTIVMLSGLTGFTTGEVLVGDGGSQSTISSGPTNTTPAAILDWDEQAISSVRSYPGGGAIHRQRLYLFDFPDIPRGVSASAAGFPDDHSIGADDGDGFFELVPEFDGQRVRHVVTADQGLIITDKATYFIPEYGTQVVTPSTIEFKLVAPIGAAQPKPAQTERGVMFIEAGTKRIIGVIPSGNVQQPWDLVDISSFWTEIMTGPRSVVADMNNSNWPERYGFVVNNDGTAAVLKYDAPSAEVPVGWTPWQTNGDFRSIFPVGGSLFAVAQRSINSVSTWFLEEFDDTVFLDCCVDYTGVADTVTEFTSHGAVDVMLHRKWLGQYAVNSSSILADFEEDDHTQTFTVTIASPGVLTATDHGLEVGFPIRVSTTGALPTGLAINTTYFVIADGLTDDTFKVSTTVGGTAVNTSGTQSGTHTLQEVYVVGFDMVTELDPLVNVKHPAYVQGKVYGIPRCYAHTMDACVYSLNGTLNPAYRMGESLDGQPELRTESKKFAILGKGSSLAPTIRQPVPSPASFTGFSMEVSF